MPQTDISVVIITRGRVQTISACLQSILQSGFQPFEILVGINGGDPLSMEALSRFKGRVQAILLPGLCRGEARNNLAARARGRWLCFLDDDTVLPEGYFSRLSALILRHQEAVVFGGGQTLSGEAGGFEKAVYALLGSSWGGGPFTERFAPVSGTRAAAAEKFILCNLTVDRLFLEERGLAFEGHLSSAEENLLLNRMAAAGAGMVLSEDLNLVHRRRKRLSQFIRQVFSSGRGRAQITALSPRGFAAFTLIPPAALVFAAAAAFFMPVLVLALSGAYLGVSLFFAVRLTGPLFLKCRVLALFPILHTAYACGWLFGLAEVASGKILRRARPLRCGCPENICDITPGSGAGKS